MTRKTVIPQKKKRGPPPTGKGQPVVVRMQPPQLAALDRWIRAQPAPTPSRPEAVRRLVELGLAATPARKSTPKAGARAAELAARAIESRTDPAASPVERDQRKQRLLKGPSVFQEMRKDRHK